MATATSETVSEVEVYRHQARMVHEVVRRNVEGLTQEESLLQPNPGGNCLNWVLGHLLSIYESALRLLGQEPVLPEGALKRYGRGTPPLQDPAEAMEIRELMAAWNEVGPRLESGLAGLTAEALDRPAPHSPTKNPNETVRSLLTTIFFHQAYHAGQTGLLRRLAGKEGAIA
jgi:uncharacterized damage-inducible protein DinB